MTSLAWTIAWSAVVLAFNGGIAWGVIRTVTPKIDKFESLLDSLTTQMGEVAAALRGLEAEQRVRHEENQRRLERLEEWSDGMRKQRRRA